MRLSQLTQLLYDLTDSIKTYTNLLTTKGQMLKDSTDTAGKIVEKGFTLEIPAEIGWTYKYIEFPFDIDLMTGLYESPSGESGDKVTASVLPPTQGGVKGIVGQTSVVTVSGSDIITVPTGIGNYFDEGANTITLLNTSNGDSNTRLVTGVDTDLVSIGQVSDDDSGSTYSLDKEFPVDSVIILERVFAEHTLVQAGSNMMGKDSWGSSAVPSNYIIKAGYYNSTATAKTVGFTLYYFCGAKPE